MRKRKAIREVVGRVVIVQLVSGKTLRGVLDASAVDALVLTHADAIEGRATIPLDGRQIIPLDRVDVIQEPTLGAALSAVGAVA
jgi:small nuclear ribonucleoprotein (snRNP)-like protein